MLKVGAQAELNRRNRGKWNFGALVMVKKFNVEVEIAIEQAISDPIQTNRRRHKKHDVFCSKRLLQDKMDTENDIGCNQHQCGKILHADSKGKQSFPLDA